MKKNLHSPVFSVTNKIERILWALAYNLIFRLTPVPFFGFRRFVLQLFGARIGKGARIYPDCKIWLPANFKIGNDSTIGPNVNIYNQAVVSIGNKTIVSQGAHLCASTHDYNDPMHPPILAPIVIESDVWVCADAFVGPGTHLSAGTVVGARAVVSKKTEPWSVYAGNPARKVKDRVNFVSKMDIKPQ